MTAAPCDPATGRPLGPEHRRVVTPGQSIGWRLSGPRRCIGIWSGDDRIGCPTATPIAEAGTDAHCRACASADRGRALARDAITDDRQFALYLAWFGPGLVKVGLTAEDRGRDRLLEQGALTFTLLAIGPHTAIRRAERAVAATGLAAERISTRAKMSAWWNLPGTDERASQIASAYAAIAARTAWPEQVTHTDCQIIDQISDFGLTQPPPDSYAELTAVTESAVVVGQISAIIGQRLLLNAGTGPLLADMRRIAGWELISTSDSGHHAEGSGLTMVPRERPGIDHDNQVSLF